MKNLTRYGNIILQKTGEIIIFPAENFHIVTFSCLKDRRNIPKKCE